MMTCGSSVATVFQAQETCAILMSSADVGQSEAHVLQIGFVRSIVSWRTRALGWRMCCWRSGLVSAHVVSSARRISSTITPDLLPRVAGAPRTCLLLATWLARRWCCNRISSNMCGRGRARRDFPRVYVVVCFFGMRGMSKLAMFRMMDPSSLGWSKR